VNDPTQLGLLVDCRRLFLRGLEAKVQIGVHDFERRAAQRVVFDVDVYVSLADSTPRNDSIDEVVDYDFVRQIILRRIEAGHIDLQETLCDDVLETILAHPGVRAARVSTAKIDVYPDCVAVGCERFASKVRP
jgi:7,8-dihydroneopterin aldolase/epimerase/oxygenase